MAKQIANIFLGKEPIWYDLNERVPIIEQRVVLWVTQIAIELFLRSMQQ